MGAYHENAPFEACIVTLLVDAPSDRKDENVSSAKINERNAFFQCIFQRKEYFAAHAYMPWISLTDMPSVQDHEA